MTFFGKVYSIIQKDWTVNRRNKTLAELDAEKYLLCILSLAHHDYGALFPVLLALFMLGQFTTNTSMNMSVVILPEAKLFIPISLLVEPCLGTSAAILGPWLENATGATLFLIGYIGAGVSIAMKSIIGIYISYGVVAAIGMGICYSLPISVVQFLDLRGTRSGVAECGFGAGPVTQLYVSFTTFGVLMSMALYLSAIVMRTPPSSFHIRGKDMYGIDHDRCTYRSSTTIERNQFLHEPEASILPTSEGVILYSAGTQNQSQKVDTVLISHVPQRPG
ncbi:Major Facilitator Superfamily (MFS) [Thraustotheca clavata]|uniref:Major Facilitator Superfamily (MFS) n=1 Tax=Thraustotheca clavata TaxID=74557 RepID=A0A1V9YUS1_9STRA|nr:Major Facilitator Superfamily (MFS) [Thraustotheca clavata]